MKLRQAYKITKRLGWHSFRWRKRGGFGNGVWLLVPPRRAKGYRLQTIQRAWNRLAPNVNVVARWTGSVATDLTRHSTNDPLCATSSSTANMPTIDEMVQMMRELREKHPLPGGRVDVIVMTDADYRALKDHCEDALPCQCPEPLRTLAGIRIESYPTRVQCVIRAEELADRKVRVGLVGADATGSPLIATPPDTQSGE